MLRKIPLHTQIFIGMLIGIIAGVIVKQSSLSEDAIQNLIAVAKPIGDIFLRFIFMMVIPLIITAISLGISDMGDMSKLGRIGWRMFKYTVVVTGISVLLGVSLTLWIKPGESVSKADRTFLMEHFGDNAKKIAEDASNAQSHSIGDVITSIVPKNPLEDMVNAFNPGYGGGGLLAVMFFAMILGIAMSASNKEKVQPFKAMLEGLYEIVMKVIGYAMKLAPLGIAALLFMITVNLGLSILLVLLKYVMLVIFALAIQQFVVYSIILKMFTKYNPLEFFGKLKEVIITAFSTSSSNATLPVAIRVTTEELKIPREITNFVLTVGSTGNQNGTALYEGITILFLAQVFNVDLTIYHQLIVVLISVLAGIGTAGVPGGSLPVLMLILVSIGVPAESIALIYGVDRILDMSRTVLNVTGDITATAYIYAGELKRGNISGHVSDEELPKSE